MKTLTTTLLLLLLTTYCSSTENRTTATNEDLVYCEEGQNEDCYRGENW